MMESASDCDTDSDQIAETLSAQELSLAQKPISNITELAEKSAFGLHLAARHRIDVELYREIFRTISDFASSKER